MNCSLPLTFNGGHLSCCFWPLHSSTKSRSPPFLRRGMQNGQDAAPTHLVSRRRNGTGFPMLVNSNVSPGRGNFKGNSKSDVIMVDPLEAKRLAAKQMEEIQAQEKLERQRRIEAINGAWAMIGLTAGLIIEGRTGDSILTQLEGYMRFIISSFNRIFPMGLFNQY